ncbi:MAG TPA: glycosyltransferase [Candidatus Saccharimonadales bacterium]|nr:glycosyltransferase [Candidatus Saccharimonadales bacterium]
MRIVASCTTLPNRYNQLSKMLNSLKKQSHSLDAIYLTLPYKATRLNQIYQDLPDKINKQCIVVRSDIDYGPLCKLYGALVNEKNPDTMIITVDDDCYYSPHLVESLVNHAKQNKNSTICGSGALLSHFGINFISYYTNHIDDRKNNYILGFDVPQIGRCIDLLYGFGGVLYRRSFFPTLEKINDLFKYPLLNKSIFCNDDVLISGFLKKQNIKILIYPDIDYVITNDKDIDALSYDFYKMLYRLDDAIQVLKTYDMFKNIEGVSFIDSVVGKNVIAILIIIFIIICTYIIYSKIK